MPPASTHLVVVVDDEPLVRMAAAAGLQEAGFDVEEAAGAAEALTILGERGGAVRALFTDVHMPGMDGVALAHRVHQEWPRVALVVASGLPEPSTAELPPGALFFPKPYALDDIAAWIRMLLAAV